MTFDLRYVLLSGLTVAYYRMSVFANGDADKVRDGATAKSLWHYLMATSFFRKGK
jgi:hypothetical protein